jgi:threonine/homoserine/homoserine lactone efflux protein
MFNLPDALRVLTVAMVVAYVVGPIVAVAVVVGGAYLFYHAWRTKREVERKKQAACNVVDETQAKGKADTSFRE